MVWGLALPVIARCCDVEGAGRDGGGLGGTRTLPLSF